MHVLLRLFDFTSGEFLVNGVDIRRYSPADLHRRTTALFQSFSKFGNATVRENTGTGDISRISSNEAVEEALKRGSAAALLESLPFGLETKLDFGGFGSHTPGNHCAPHGRKSGSHTEVHRPEERFGLSGGEVCDRVQFYIRTDSVNPVAVATLGPFPRIHEARIRRFGLLRRAHGLVVSRSG
jgi:ABC-type Fe3+/spermidine/putrescine transport system ATPase subunit